MTYLITDYSGDPVTLDNNLWPAPSRPRRLRRACAPAPAPSSAQRRPSSSSPSPSPPPSLSSPSTLSTTFSLPPAGSLCALASGSPPLALSLRPAWLAPRLASLSAPESTAFSPSCSPSTVILAVAVSGPTPVPVPAEPLPDMISINGACHFALTSSSVSAQPPGRPPGRLPEGSPMDGLQPSSQVRPSPAPRPGAAQLQLQITHPAPVPSEGADGADHLVLGGGCFDRVYRSPPSSVAVSCPLPPSLLPSAAGRRRRLLSDLSSGAPTVGGAGGRGRSPRPGCRGASRGCHIRGRGDSRGHYPGTQGGAEATAEAAAHKVNQPAEASAQTEAEAPVTAAPASGGTFSEFATSAPSPSAVPSRTQVSPSSSSVMPRLARPALVSPVLKTPAPTSTPSGRALPPPPEPSDRPAPLPPELSPSAVPSSKASPPSSALPRLARPALFWPAREMPAPPSTTTGRALPPPPP